MTPRDRITERVSRNGDLNRENVLLPVLTLDEFFDGNDIYGSIGCNLPTCPSPAEIYEELKAIAARPNVVDVRVLVTQFDDPEWPFSDVVWVVTDASPEVVASWFDDDMRPDECAIGWDQQTATEPYRVPEGMTLVVCWWD